MDKIIAGIGIVLALLLGDASAAAVVKDCHVGANPWREGRQVNPATEKEYRLDEPLFVENIDKKGRTVLCRLAPSESTIVFPNGFDSSVDHPGLPVEQFPWIKGCGNPIVSKFKLAIKSPAPVVAAATPVAPVATPLPAAVQPEPLQEGTVCSASGHPGVHRVVDGRLRCLWAETSAVPQAPLPVRIIVAQPAPQVQERTECFDSGHHGSYEFIGGRWRCVWNEEVVVQQIVQPTYYPQQQPVVYYQQQQVGTPVYQESSSLGIGLNFSFGNYDRGYQYGGYGGYNDGYYNSGYQYGGYVGGGTIGDCRNCYNHPRPPPIGYPPSQPPIGHLPSGITNPVTSGPIGHLPSGITTPATSGTIIGGCSNCNNGHLPAGNATQGGTGRVPGGYAR